MKILTKILYVILGLLTLLSIFVVICGFQPDLSKAVLGYLYSLSGNAGAYQDNEAMVEEEKDVPPSIAVNTVDSVPSATDITIPDVFAEDRPPESDYIPPERNNIATPAEVSGRSGYEPVKDDTQQIDDDAARELQEQLSYGETGDGLTFNEEYYPYYGMLDSNLQRLYRQIYANAMAANKNFAPVEEVNRNQLKNVFMAVFNDHPEIFWLDSAYSAKISRSGKCVEIQLQFNNTANNLGASKNNFNSAAEAILSGARNLGSDYEKEVYVHNALLDKAEYNLRAPLNQNAYSALVNGQTVCAGYARAFQYLMQQLNVPCYYCTGYAGESHAWNIIRLDGDYYNVDTTWDDTNPNTLDYFNKTDADFAKDHVREELSVYLPACNGTKYRGTESNSSDEQPVYNEPPVSNEQPVYNDQPVNLNSDSGRRSLEEAGFAEQDVLTTLQDYYADCYNKIMQSGGSLQFENVIADEKMWMACYNAYNSKAYANGYLYRALEELSASSGEVVVETEELKDGRILLKHNITIK